MMSAYDSTGSEGDEYHYLVTCWPVVLKLNCQNRTPGVKTHGKRGGRTK